MTDGLAGVVRFLELEPYRPNGVRDRKKGRLYLLTAEINKMICQYLIDVRQAIGGIKDGIPLWDLHFENTGGLFPEILDIKKVGGSLMNGEAGYIEREWEKQFYSDPELLEEAERYGNFDVIERVKMGRKKYVLTSNRTEV